VIRRLGIPLAVALATAALAVTADPPPAQALNLAKPICTLAGIISTAAGRVCSVASHAGSVVKVGKKLLSGHLGGAVKTIVGGGAKSAVHAVTVGAALAAVVGWVTGGTKFALRETAQVISSTTRPELQSSWFSASYWRMSGVAALLTLPFLFASAIQALIRSDLALLLRSAFGYLPLGMLAVSIAAPVTMLLLAASDELSSIVSSASGDAGESFLVHTSVVATGLGALTGSGFPTLVIGMFTVGAAMTLWVELLIRAAAVYVIVLMLPLFFAALVWPARRIWAVRSVEVLIALILSKFVIVAVLSLGGAALGHTTVPSVTQMLEGTTLVVLAAFSPWALLRLLPLHELTGGLAGLRSNAQQLALAGGYAADATEYVEAYAAEIPAELVRRASSASDPGEPVPADAVARNLDGSDGESVATEGDDGAPNGPPEPGAVDSAGPGSDTAPTTSSADDGPPASDPGPPLKEWWTDEKPGERTFILGAETATPPPHEDSPRPPTRPAPPAPPPSPPPLDEPPAPDDDVSPPDDHDPRPPAQEGDEGPL
jgi:hypothetical protein